MPRNRVQRRRIGALALGLVLACSAPVAGAAAADAGASAAPRSTAVSIAGQVRTPTTLGVEDLKHCSVHDVLRHPEHPREGADATAVDHYSACRLRDILDQVGLLAGARGDLRRSYIVVTASDGYQVVYSWGEIYNSPLGDDVYLAFARNGAPIDDAEGSIAIFSLQDSKPGPRYARGVASIEVMRASAPAH